VNFKGLAEEKCGLDHIWPTAFSQRLSLEQKFILQC